MLRMPMILHSSEKHLVPRINQNKNHLVTNISVKNTNNKPNNNKTTNNKPNNKPNNNKPANNKPNNNKRSTLGHINNNIKMRSPFAGSMIDLVHKAKPGCSACGKKVA